MRPDAPATSRSRTPSASAPAARGSSRRRSARRPRPTSSASRPSSAAASTELIQAGFETLVGAGYQPEVAYYECLHELKLIVDLIWEGGLQHMRWSISDTAEFGDYLSGPRVIDEHVREQMGTILDEIRSGAFAKTWIADMENGEEGLRRRRAEAAGKQIETVGEELRSLMRREDASAVR